MSACSDVSRTRVLSGDPSRRCGIERTREAAVDRKRLRHGWWQFRQHETRTNCLGLARRSLYDDAGDQTAGRIDGNRSDRVPLSGRRGHEVEWLARHRAPNRDYRVRVRYGSAERQSNDGARVRTRRRDRDARCLGTQRSGNECEDYDCCDASSHGLSRMEEVSRKLTLWYSRARLRFMGLFRSETGGIEPRTVLLLSALSVEPLK